MMEPIAVPDKAPAVGSKVWVAHEKLPYTVRAANARYAVCNKPFSARHTVLYCILDVVDAWRAPEDLIFGLGAETVQECEAILARLEAGETGLSVRRGVAWDVTRIEEVRR